MTEGEDVPSRVIRVRLGGTASESDVGALKNWLEREKPLEELVRRGELEIHERAGTDEHGTPMGAGMEIVLLLAGAAAQSGFDTLFKQVRKGVKAWWENRSSVESGPPPDYDVDQVDIGER